MTLPGQMTSPLPGGGLALSCAKPVEEGARVALLLAPDRFRLDVRPLEDTLMIVVRPLGDESCTWYLDDAPEQWVQPAAIDLRPGAHAATIEGRGWRAEVTVATTREPENGITHFVAQAVLRESPDR